VRRVARTLLRVYRRFDGVDYSRRSGNLDCWPMIAALVDCDGHVGTPFQISMVLLTKYLFS